MSISAAVAAGDRRAVLLAQLQLLAGSMDEAGVDDLSALSREIRLVLKELEGLGDGLSANSREDALAARRKAKQAANG